jgi:hypothetical protein
MGVITNLVVTLPIAEESVVCNQKISYDTQMLITGNQLKAARALAGVDQLGVAKAAKVAVNTIRNMESRGADPITSGAVTVRNVQSALEAAGVEFTNGDQPGVRLRKTADARR